MTDTAPEMTLTVIFGHIEFLPTTYRFIDHGDGSGELRGTGHSVRVAEDGTRTPSDEESPVVIRCEDNAELLRSARLAGYILDPPVHYASWRPPAPPSFVQRVKRWLRLAA